MIGTEPASLVGLQSSLSRLEQAGKEVYAKDFPAAAQRLVIGHLVWPSLGEQAILDRSLQGAQVSEERAELLEDAREEQSVRLELAWPPLMRVARLFWHRNASEHAHHR